MSRELFMDWVCILGEKQSNYCYINSEKYKSVVFKNLMDPYIETFQTIHKHLDVSTYKKCMALFRQLSKQYNIPYKYKIRYVNSTYYIDYYFYI